LRDRDHVGERPKDIGVRHQMVLRAVLDHHRALGAGRPDGVNAHRHSSVQRHDPQIHQ
jgi:hypothetical protein